MIILSNGHKLEYVVASGALAFDGQGWWWERILVWLGLIKPQLFTTFLKTLTRHRRIGNLSLWWPFNCIRLIAGGAVNKVGLTNKGIDWWCKKVGPYLNYKKFALVASIHGDEEELVAMTRLLNVFGFVAIEVNPSCPNADPLEATETIIRIVKAVKHESHHPVIVKLSVAQDYLAIAKGVVGYAEAISLNSVDWKIVFPDKPSPLSKLEKKVGGGGGGVSGKPAQKHNWAAVEALAEQGLIPVIAPGIMEYEDIDKVEKLKAKAFSFGTIFMRTPWKPTSIVLRREKEKKSCRKTQ